MLALLWAQKLLNHHIKRKKFLMRTFLYSNCFLNILIQDCFFWWFFMSEISDGETRHQLPLEFWHSSSFLSSVVLFIFMPYFPFKKGVFFLHVLRSLYCLTSADTKLWLNFLCTKNHAGWSEKKGVVSQQLRHWSFNVTAAKFIHRNCSLFF